MIERIPHRSNPQLFDKAVLPIQQKLADNLPWLNHSFGITEILTQIVKGKKVRSANIYLGNGEYELIEPCTELGNFSYFILRDAQEILPNETGIIKSPFSLIIWYDMRKVYINSNVYDFNDDFNDDFDVQKRYLKDERNREAVKAHVLGLLNGMHNPNFRLTKVYDDPKNIFIDCSYEHTENQCLMSPYAGLRIDGYIIAKIPCVL